MTMYVVLHVSFPFRKKETRVCACNVSGLHSFIRRILVDQFLQSLHARVLVKQKSATANAKLERLYCDACDVARNDEWPGRRTSPRVLIEVEKHR
jgi:hypothetical protein